MKNSSFDFLRSALAKVHEIKGETFVIKLPADIIIDPSMLQNFAENVAMLKNLGAKVLVVHDHGEAIKSTIKALGLREDILEDNKGIDLQAIQLIEMVVSGHLNKTISAAITKAGANAIGISAKDSNLIEAQRVKVAKKREDTNIQDIFDLGFMGDPVVINPEILVNLEDADVVTVLSPIAYGEKGETFLLDVNLTAAILAAAMAASRLFLLAPEGGLKIQGENATELSIKDLAVIKKHQKFSTKYLHLLEAAESSIANHTENVHILDSTVPDVILKDLFGDERHGTMLYSNEY